MSKLENIKQNQKIFIIEDDTLIIRIYEKMFKLLGYKTEFISNGEEAIKELETTKEKPTLIILDIMIPKISGFDVLSRIKKNKSLKDIPVVVLTNLVAMGDSEKALGLGAALYLIKSQYELQEIVKKVKEIIDRK